METLWRDVRQTLRWMARQKGFTAAACLTFALGIGANTAIFSILWGVLLKPLPYADPGQLVRVSEEHTGASPVLREPSLSNLIFQSWSPSLRTLESLAPYSPGEYTVGREDPERLEGAAVSPSLFPLLRVVPAAGRFFAPEEAAEGAEDVVVLSHGFWRSRFGGRPEAIGRSIVVGGHPSRIVGVAPAGFAFPSRETKLWKPLVVPHWKGPEDLSLSVFRALGRLKPGATPLQAAAEGTGVARAAPRQPAADLLFGPGGSVVVRVQPFAEQMTARIRPALLLLAVAVGLVLLIACANISNLFLARSIARQRELAVRAALGAGGRRLAGQLLTESLVLALCGGVLGLFLAWGLTRAVPALAPEDLPRLEEIRLDGRVLAFALAASLLSGLLSGLVPAWRGLRTGPAPALRDGGQRAMGGAGRGLRGGLLVIEAALAVVLLVGAGLLVRSLVRLIQVDGGYRPDHVLTAQVYLPDADQQPGRNVALMSTLLERLAALPGVAAAGAGTMIPLGGRTAMLSFNLPPADPDGEPVSARANYWIVTPDFGRALGLRIKEGRFLKTGDAQAGFQAIVVNEELVRLYLKDGKPVVGRRIPEVLGIDGKGRETEIVGVAGNVLMNGPDQAPQPEIYFVAAESGGGMFTQPFVLIRTAGDRRALALAPELRRLVHEIEPRAALDNVDLLAHRVSESVAQPRFAALVLSVFAAVASMLAATGLYGVLSYGVSRRRRELGIRAALGSTRAGIGRLVLREGLALTAAGLALGIGAALGVTRLMASLLFGVEPLDVLSFAAAPIALLAVAAAACLVPARRAAAVDPAEALRSE